MKRLTCSLMLLLFPVVGFCEAVNDDEQISKRVDFVCYDVTAASGNIKMSMELNKDTDAARLVVAWEQSRKSAAEDISEVVNVYGIDEESARYSIHVPGGHRRVQAWASDDGMEKWGAITHKLSFDLERPSVEFQARSIKDIKLPSDVSLSAFDHTDLYEDSHMFRTMRFPN